MRQKLKERGPFVGQEESGKPGVARNFYDDLACEPLLELPPLFGHYELYKNNDLLHAVPFLRLSPPTFRSPCFRCSGSYIQSKTAGIRGLVYKHTGLQNVFHEGFVSHTRTSHISCGELRSNASFAFY